MILFKSQRLDGHLVEVSISDIEEVPFSWSDKRDAKVITARKIPVAFTINDVTLSNLCSLFNNNRSLYS